MRTESCDILVLGSGIAGLSLALHCADLLPGKRIVVLSKGRLRESNTRYAQGGIAAVMDKLNDSFEQHITDTLVAGEGLCDPEIVKTVVESAPALMEQLMEWGVNFDRMNSGLSLGKEGGHSTHRILHCKDYTGASIVEVLLKRCYENPGIELRENQFVLDLLLPEDGAGCRGALINSSGDVYIIKAPHTILATGGAGRLYTCTSNPEIATGDGMALAIRAGARLNNMAFVQFHPTVLHQGPGKTFLISEAIRGFGGILRNQEGEDFMYRYDHRGSLATRDVVSRAIFKEMGSVGHVWLDVTHLPPDRFREEFPTIFERLKDAGIDPSVEMIPIKPAAHYFCGGISTNSYGQTSLPGLWALGECAHTGLHGANRLASNSLLEALVFARRAALKMSCMDMPIKLKTTEVSLRDGNFDKNWLSSIYSDVRQIMTEHAGIVRNGEGLSLAKTRLNQLRNLLDVETFDKDIVEIKNLILVALAVVDDSLEQEENRGGFYRSDYEKEVLLYD